MVDVLSPVGRDAAEGNSLDVLGNHIVFKAEGADTGGRFLLMEFTVPAHSDGPRPHVHRHTDEAFYVLDGRVTIEIGNQSIQAEPGAFVFAPRGLAHKVSNLEDSPARYLAMMTPAGLEGWFRDLAALVQPGMPRPEPGTIAALSDKYDHVMTAPPPASGAD